MKKLLLKLTEKTFLGVVIIAVLLLFSFDIFAQQASGETKIVDQTVATVSDGVRTELITYSDLLWQLALIPNIPLTPPTSEDLNRALQVIIRQRLIALDAERLPSAEPTRNDIEAEIRRVLAQFPSSAEFVRRLNTVGFDSIDDENFQEMMRERVAIEKYIDFRFRSFVVITPEDEETYYRGDFTTDFRRRNPGLLLPPFEDVQEQINRTLTEQRVERDIERFLDNAESRAEIVVLNEV